MRCAFKRSAVLTELATAPLNRCLIFESSSMKKFAVEPEPTPIHALSTTYLIASRATACFSSSWVMDTAVLLLSRRWQIGANTLVGLGGEAHRFTKCGMRMDGPADIHTIRAHFDRQRDFADQG